MISNSNDENFLLYNVSIPDTLIFVLTFRPYSQS